MIKPLIKYSKKIKINNIEENKIINEHSNVDMSIFNSNNKTVVEFNKIVSNDFKIAMRKHIRYINYPKHSHNYIEFNYVLSGEIHQIVENQKITIKEGDLLILGQNIEHEILLSNKDDIMINFIIHSDFFNSIFEFINDNIDLSNFFIDAVIKKHSSKALIFNISKTKNIQEIMFKIIKLLEEEEINNFIESKIKLLMGLFIMEITEETPIIISKKSYEKEVLSKVFYYIEHNLKTASLNEISKILNFKNYNLSKLIKKECNYNFKQLVQEKKLKKFCNLLTVSNLSIYDLAIDVGFSNSSSFYKLFKKKFDISPKEYRQNSKLNHEL